MTEWEMIKDIRLKVDDPPGMINLETVPTPDDLPSEPKRQTTYRVEESGEYMTTDRKTGANLADYKYTELRISDDQILSIISSVGYENSLYRILHRIIAKLGSQLGIVRMADGAESTEYISLLNAYKYYKSLADDYKQIAKEDSGNNTGRVGYSKQPEIAGGNL